MSGAVSWDAYVDFRRRALIRLAALADLNVVEDEGLVGAVAPSGVRGGLLVTAPLDPPRVAAALEVGTPQWVGLLPPAIALVDELRRRGWDVVEERSAMALENLADVAPAELPEDVEAVPVAVRAGAAGYSLEAALRLSLEYGQPGTHAATRDLELEATMLRRLTGILLFAAVARDGSCVGTAGSRVVEHAALVASVVTHPSARGRGIGTAMTCLALRAARRAGATEAFLDATDAGRGVYSRLGFAHVGTVVYCERPA